MTRVLVTVAVFIVILNVWMFFQQPSLVFFPDRKISITPAGWGLSFEDVYLDVEQGVRIHGWYVPRQGAKQVVLFLHGNAGNMSHRGDSIRVFHRLGFNVFIIDYRGYGNSTGKPGEKGIYADAEAAWKYLLETKGFQRRQVIVFGRSLGGSVAAWLAARHRPALLIVESSFRSARAMANRVLPGFSWLVLLRYRFNTADAVRKVRSPVLVVHSVDDEIIPFSHGQRIYESANPPKELLKISGSHNGGFISSQPGYEQGLAAFIRKYIGQH